MLAISFWNWDKEINQGLCDVQQAQKSKLKKFTISETGIIYRSLSNFDLVFVPIKNVRPQTLKSDHQAILHVTESEGLFKITDIKSKEEESPNEPLTLIANSQNSTISRSDTDLESKRTSLNQKPIQLQEGSLIMLGKASIELIKISCTPKPAIKNIYQRPQSIPFMNSIKRVSVSNYQYAIKKQNKSNQKGEKRQKLDSPKSRQKYEYKQIKIESPRSEQQPSIKQGKGDRSKSRQRQIDNSVQVMQFSMYDDNPTCKICYSKTIDPRNSLVCLCKCSGSAKFTHEHCLKKWVQQKSGLHKIKSSAGKQVYKACMDGFQCQICKEHYCYDKIFRLILDMEVNQEYVLMSVGLNGKKCLYLVSLSGEQTISIGRQIQSDISIVQLTVSRQHCQLHFNKQQKSIQLVDLDSKFGSVVKKSSLMINSQNRAARMQKGRTYMQIDRLMGKRKQGFLKRLFMCCQEMN